MKMNNEELWFYKSTAYPKYVVIYYRCDEISAYTIGKNTDSKNIIGLMWYQKKLIFKQYTL